MPFFLCVGAEGCVCKILGKQAQLMGRNATRKVILLDSPDVILCEWPFDGIRGSFPTKQAKSKIKVLALVCKACFAQQEARCWNDKRTCENLQLIRHTFGLYTFGLTYRTLRVQQNTNEVFIRGPDRRSTDREASPSGQGG